MNLLSGLLITSNLTLLFQNQDHFLHLSPAEQSWDYGQGFKM